MKASRFSVIRARSVSDGADGRSPPPSLTLRALMELAIFNWLLDKGFRFDHDGGSTPCQPELSESGCWPRSLIQQGEFHDREQQGNLPGVPRAGGSGGSPGPAWFHSRAGRAN